MLNKLEQNGNELADFASWLLSIPSKHSLELEYLKWDKQDCTTYTNFYLHDETVEIVFKYYDFWNGEYTEVDVIAVPPEWLDKSKEELEPIVIKEYIEYDREVKDKQLQELKYKARLLGYKLEKINE